MQFRAHGLGQGHESIQQKVLFVFHGITNAHQIDDRLLIGTNGQELDISIVCIIGMIVVLKTSIVGCGDWRCGVLI